MTARPRPARRRFANAAMASPSLGRGQLSGASAPAAVSVAARPHCGDPRQRCPRYPRRGRTRLQAPGPTPQPRSCEPVRHSSDAGPAGQTAMTPDARVLAAFQLAVHHLPRPLPARRRQEGGRLLSPRRAPAGGSAAAIWSQHRGPQHSGITRRARLPMRPRGANSAAAAGDGRRCRPTAPSSRRDTRSDRRPGSPPGPPSAAAGAAAAGCHRVAHRHRRIGQKAAPAALGARHPHLQGKRGGDPGDAHRAGPHHAQRNQRQHPARASPAPPGSKTSSCAHPGMQHFQPARHGAPPGQTTRPSAPRSLAPDARVRSRPAPTPGDSRRSPLRSTTGEGGTDA